MVKCLFAELLAIEEYLERMSPFSSKIKPLRGYPYTRTGQEHT